MVALIAGYYFYVSNRSNAASGEEVTTGISEAQKLLARSMATDYPPTPKEVVKYYADITVALYNSEYTDEEFEKFSRDKNTKRRYGRAWKRIRDKYAAEHPFCEKCYEHGVLVPVEEIHHKLPLSEGGTHGLPWEFWSYSGSL